jgi:S1-C subfamily serine protease
MIGYLFRTFWFAALLAFAVNPLSLRAELKPEKLYQKVLPSVMTLEVENGAGEQFIGSAVLALADDVAVTAWHVVADARLVTAVFADGSRVKVIGCVDQDGVHDLALLKLEKPLANRRAVLCREMQSVAARAYVIGAPKGFDFSISDGLISQIRSVDGFPQYQVSCPISPGNSGGPVLNDRGEVIGIASWTKSDAQNVSFAIPAREILNLNPSGTAKLWEDLTSAGRPSLAARSVESRRGSISQRTDGSAGGLEDLKKRLKEATGKPVTIVVREGQQSSTYTFTVPGDEVE